VKVFKILCFFDKDTGRDVEMLLPLIYFVERFYKCEIVHAFVYDEHAIYRSKPDMVLLPNTVGSHMYYDIAKYAIEQGIQVFALDSEGNYRIDDSFDYWGYNLDKKILQEYLCLWSYRIQKYMVSELPQESERIVVTGAVGFDRYKIYDFLSKQDYLIKHNLTKYTKVIGYAGWAFGKIYYEKGRESLIQYFKRDESKLSLIEPERKKIEDILRETIENNSDILFILKKHPTERRPTEPEIGINEMADLKDYPNVIYEGEYTSIHDLINVSDLWLSFESTTAIEAWIRNKYTILIRPSSNFSDTIKEKGLYDSQVVVKNYNELQSVISEYYSIDKVHEFLLEEKVKVREKVISDTIGFSDGYNHIRSAYYLMLCLKRIDKSKIIYIWRLKYFIRYILIKLGILLYNRTIYKKLYKAKKFIWVFEQYDLKKVEQLYHKYSLFLDRFYKENKIEERLKEGNLFKEILELDNRS